MPPPRPRLTVRVGVAGHRWDKLKRQHADAIRERRRPVPGNQLNEPFVDGEQTHWQRGPGGGPNHAALDQPRDSPRVIGHHDPIADHRRSRIDPENRHASASAIVAVSMSKLANTLETSSCSSSISISLISLTASSPSTRTVFFGTIAISADSTA